MLTLNILGTPKPRQALCVSCTYAVMQKGRKGEELTSCNYAGVLREVTFTVCECSAYADRRAAKPERQIGFVRPERKSRGNVTVIRIA